MANLKTRVLGKANLSNRSNYNAFDLSHRNCFTNATGTLCPVAVLDVLPTEKVSLNIGWFSRAQTLISNSYGRFVENVQAFYVPFSSIYRNYSQNALTSALSNAKGDNECRISDGLGVTQPLNDGRLPGIDLADVFEVLFYTAMYEVAYANYYKASLESSSLAETDTPASDFKLLSRSYMTRSMSMALLLEQLGYGSFSDFTDPSHRTEMPLPLSMQPNLERGKLVISPLSFAKMFADAGSNTAANVKQWWHSHRNAYGTAVSPMHLMAYHKVYNDYYRNDTWQPYESETCNLDYLFRTSYKLIEFPWSKTVTATTDTWSAKMDAVIDAMFAAKDATSWEAVLALLQEFIDETSDKSAFFSDYNFLDPRNSNLPLDAVNGVLPEPQYGSDAEVVITNVKGDIGLEDWQANGNSTLIYHGRKEAPVQGQGKLGLKTNAGTIYPAGLSFSVRDMRIAESLQKFKEISISNDNYFVNQLKAHFGEAPIYDPFKTYFIGGKSTIMQVDTQVNQNLAEENNATLGGLASAQGNFTANYKADDYGCIIVLHNVYPIVDYPNDGIAESVLCTTANALPIPEFDNNGFEGIRNVYVRGLDPKNYSSLYGDDKNPLGVYGYGARYWSWKTARDVVNGDFKYTLKDKIMGYVPLRTINGLVPNSLIATPLLTDQIFANQHHSNVSDDQFYTNMSVGVSILRPFSVHGLPFAN